MKFSLTYQTAEETNPASQVLYDLSIDRIIARICPDQKKREVFLHVLSCPLRRRDNIRYRQEIMRDFIELPDMFDALSVIFRRYDRVKNDWIEMRAGLRTNHHTANPEALLDYTMSSLKMTAAFPRTIVSYYESVYDILKTANIKSEGLMQIRAYCKEMLENHALQEIIEIASDFQGHNAEEYEYALALQMDTSLRILASDLSRMEQRKKEKLFHFSFTRKPDERSKYADCYDEAVDVGRRLLADAFRRIDTAFAEITNGIYDNFYGLSEDIMFYDVALQCCAYLTEKKIPLCFPTVKEAQEDIFEVLGMRDLLLITEKQNADEIIPADITLEPGKGLLIRGKNSTGKTTTLRAIGITQVFLQAGLPVCCETACISIRNAVYTHFASAEEDFAVQDNAGRFEGEVRAVAHIMENIQPYSLVLLNETFQTTAYREGAEGMYHILQAFSRIRVKCIFVTHLLSLFPLLAKDHAVYQFAETDRQRGAYRLYPITM